MWMNEGILSSDNRDRLICENGASIAAAMRRDCFENAVILRRRVLSFVVVDISRQANDVHSTNATKLRLKLNIERHWLCVNEHWRNSPPVPRQTKMQDIIS